jgi:hypothetical protein
MPAVGELKRLNDLLRMTVFCMILRKLKLEYKVKMATSQPPEFSYIPLRPGSIRLLEIMIERGRLPRSLNQHNLFDGQDVLVSQIHVADLNDPPLYDALSYTWGNPLSAFETKSDWEQAERRYSSKVPFLCSGKLLYIGYSLH